MWSYEDNNNIHKVDMEMYKDMELLYIVATVIKYNCTQTPLLRHPRSVQNL